MSEDEKMQQIGLTVRQYQSAKVDLAQLNQKLAQVGETYKEVGHAIVNPMSSSGDFKIDGKHFHLVYSHAENENLSAKLLNEESLVALVVERDAAKEKVSNLRAQLNALGITNLE